LYNQLDNLIPSIVAKDAQTAAVISALTNAMVFYEKGQEDCIAYCRSASKIGSRNLFSTCLPIGNTGYTTPYRGAPRETRVRKLPLEVKETRGSHSVMFEGYSLPYPVDWGATPKVSKGVSVRQLMEILGAKLPTIVSFLSSSRNLFQLFTPALTELGYLQPTYTPIPGVVVFAKL